MKNTLPKYIFFTGVPGSRWSGIAQEIKQDARYDTSDRAPHRVYTHGEFSGHKDAYFGTGMEFPAILDEENLEEPFTGTGTRLLMSHEWPYYFDDAVFADTLMPLEPAQLDDLKEQNLDTFYEMLHDEVMSNY